MLQTNHHIQVLEMSPGSRRGAIFPYWPFTLLFFLHILLCNLTGEGAGGKLGRLALLWVGADGLIALLKGS